MGSEKALMNGIESLIVELRTEIVSKDQYDREQLDNHLMLNTTTSEGPVVIVSFILLAVSFRFDSCDPK